MNSSSSSSTLIDFLDLRQEYEGVEVKACSKNASRKGPRGNIVAA
jgi:hypothetical protein